MERNPSHLGSNDIGPLGIWGTDFASIGATGGITGSCMLAILAYPFVDQFGLSVPDGRVVVMTDPVFVVPDAVLDDLRTRLQNTRWPSVVDGQGWSRGADLDYLRELLGYWQAEFDWRSEGLICRLSVPLTPEITTRQLTAQSFAVNGNLLN